MKCIVLIVFFVKVFYVDAKDVSCEFVPMTSWAHEASRRQEILKNPVDMAVIQHTASVQCVTDAQCEGAARSIRQHQMDQLGFTDIGISFLVGGNGKVYEGAGWHRVGAHTKGYNTVSISISFIGDFRESLPTEEALEAAENLLDCGVRQQHLKSDYRLVNHNQLSNTQSPGDMLADVIKTWPHWVQNVKN